MILTSQILQVQTFLVIQGLSMVLSKVIPGDPNRPVWVKPNMSNTIKSTRVPMNL